MELQLEITERFGHYYLNLKAENVNIEEQISKVDYAIDLDGERKPIRLPEDITNESLDLIFRIAEDMIYYRKSEYDSSTLVKCLIDKLSNDQLKDVLKYVDETYII